MIGELGIKPLSAERSSQSAARCRCRGSLRFTTDALGRTVESCDNCHYSGAVRLVAILKPPSGPRRGKTRAPAFQLATFRCGHLRTSENSYRHPKGYSHCRECTKSKARKSGRAVA
jgi:hypothetical protein